MKRTVNILRSGGRLAAGLLAAVILTGGACSLAAQDLAIRDAHVITISGKEHERATVVVQGGVIRAVGPDAEIPAGLPVIEGRGKVLMPSFVMAQTSGGLDRANEMMPVVPFVSVRDSMDPSSTFFEDALRDGHLTMLVMPSERTVVGGMGMVVHPRGLTVEQMTVDAEAGLKLSLVPMRGSRARQYDALRSALDDAKRHYEDKARGTEQAKLAAAKGDVRAEIRAVGVDARKEPLVRAIRGELPVYIACGTAGDVLNAITLIDDFGLKAKLVCGIRTWRAAPMIAAKKLDVILDDTLEFRETDPRTGREVRRVLPKIFKDAGVRFTVQNGPASLGARYLWYQAARLVAHGFTRAEALRIVTHTAAEVIGLGKRKGAIAKGMDADMLLLTADPLSGQAWVERGIVGGQVVYRRENDPRLAEIFGTGPMGGRSR